MHGKKGGKSPRGAAKKSPAKGKKKLLSGSIEDSPEASTAAASAPAAEENALISDERIDAYLDPTGADSNGARIIDAPPGEDSSSSSSDELTEETSAEGPILRKALESPRRTVTILDQKVITPAGSNVPLSSPTVPSTIRPIPPSVAQQLPQGIIRSFLEGNPSLISGPDQPLNLQMPMDEDAEPLAGAAGISPSLTSPAHRPRISPKKRQSPSAAGPSTSSGVKSPPTPSKVAKTSTSNPFDADSPLTEVEYFMVEPTSHKGSNVENVRNVMTSMPGGEKRNVTFMKQPISQTSSSSTDDSRSAQSRTSQESKIYIRTIQEDRFTHMAWNIAEKFRLLPDMEQQFLAETLQHVILSEALAGRLTRAHTVRSSNCVHCSREIKDESSRK